MRRWREELVRSRAGRKPGSGPTCAVDRRRRTCNQSPQSVGLTDGGPMTTVCLAAGPAADADDDGREAELQRRRVTSSRRGAMTSRVCLRRTLSVDRRTRDDNRLHTEPKRTMTQSCWLSAVIRLCPAAIMCRIRTPNCLKYIHVSSLLQADYCDMPGSVCVMLYNGFHVRLSSIGYTVI